MREDDDEPAIIWAPARRPAPRRPKLWPYVACIALAWISGFLARGALHGLFGFPC